MAKKKNFDDIVEQSFNEGYTSEPEIVSEKAQPEQRRGRANSENERELRPEAKERFFKVLDKKGFDEALKSLNPAEKEILARELKSGDEEIVVHLLGFDARSTYYLTDWHRACIDVVSHKKGIKKNEVIVAALEHYIAEEGAGEEAKELVVSRAITKLDQESK